MNSQKKALFVSLLFLIVGIVGTITIDNFSISLPLIIFYFTITINTYFSIKLYAGIVPKENVQQKNVDALLFLLYLALAFTFNHAQLFIFLTGLLFSIAVIKYALLLGRIDYQDLLRKKICIDILGVMMALVAYGIFSFGYTEIAVWFMAGIFCIANIYLLLVKPMYTI